MRHPAHRVKASIAVLVLLSSLGFISTANSTSRTTDQTLMKRLIIKEARDLGVSASLALAVAHAESSFNQKAESAKGARGIMQIMPATAIGEYGIEPNLLWNPRINIRLGLHYLGRLIERYNGRTELALSFYNGGSAVGKPGRARVIPATYAYVRKVRGLQSFYRSRLRRGRL